jgi:Na+/proline symporter
MGVPFWAIAVGAVSLVWVYTHKSGIKTIVWTDTLQTFCLIAALICIIYQVTGRLDMGFGEMVHAIRTHEHSGIFVFDDWVSRQNFFKQFISGIFIVIVMTGLDQDMMQKNLSCRNLKEAQRNMYCYGFSFIPLNFLFLCLGILLLVLAGQTGVALPGTNDDILPLFATQGYLGQPVLVFFSIGIIAAAFSNSDSALASMTTAFCVDILDTGKDTEDVARRKRRKVHIALSVILVVFICFFRMLNSQSVIDAVYVIASYTYGPLLGMFAFGLFTRRKANDKYTPYIAIASPLICYVLDCTVSACTGYKLGYELLMLNGALTFAGLSVKSS